MSMPTDLHTTATTTALSSTTAYSTTELTAFPTGRILMLLILFKLDVPRRMLYPFWVVTLFGPIMTYEFYCLFHGDWSPPSSAEVLVVIAAFALNECMVWRDLFTRQRIRANWREEANMEYSLKKLREENRKLEDTPLEHVVREAEELEKKWEESLRRVHEEGKRLDDQLWLMKS